MTKYREILRLKSLNLSQQNIAHSYNVSKKTVNRVLKRAEELGISCPLDENDTDAVLAEKLFPSVKQNISAKRMPDYDYIRKELLCNGVIKKLLQTEYIDKLIEMRLTSMADAFCNQFNDPKFEEIPFEDRFAMLVDIEYSNQKNNRLKRLIHNAGFDPPDVNIMDINYTSGRKLNKNLISRLATCKYISKHRNLFITGATGCGKTYMACAFGMEACKRYFTTRYVRLPDLLIDLEIARAEGNYRKVMAKYANPLVLILDEQLFFKPTEIEQKDIFELLHRRRKKSSTIFCSQYGFEEWYNQLGGDDSPLADAIIDRIAHDSYRINITSIDAEHDVSMREVYGLDKMLCE